ncbi:MAG: TonB-dependent receptor, partial [Muribaculaceae bacterium]|nr:TonB-dependent receptor [Muribaculaceae bacterium]
KPTVGVMGTNYTAYGAPIGFSTNEVLHRYYSCYFTGNYVFDSRYSVSGSYRVDKADMFGTDPKFRGKPLWSVGGSWNAHNEEFLRPYTWISALKLRASYGLTGNIDNSVSSYLTGRINTNKYGNLEGYLRTPPNDQLRWEKTETWNAGIDFAFFGYRLAGTLDFYRKNGSDILTDAELDPTTGWTTQKINSAKMTNTGIELQLDGQIIQARRRSDIGISLGLNIGYNKNKVTDLRRYPASASEFLNMTYHKGYPLNSLFSINYAGLVKNEDGAMFVGWYDKNGNVQTTSTSSSTFTMDDLIFSGSTTPKFSGSLIPEIKWNGFSLSAMMSFYGGHYMRTDNTVWNAYYAGTAGYKATFGNGAISRDMLRYFEGDEVPANGYMETMNGSNVSTGRLRNTAIEHADYMKLRNIVLTYNFDKKLCKKIGLNDLRLRVQMNNVATWTRNSLGIDPEAYNLSQGSPATKTPRSYTMSLFFNL